MKPRREPKMRRETLKKRDDILEAATEVFAQRGYHNSSLTEIASKVDMTHAGILHHFGSKRELLIETLKFRDRRGTSQEQRLPLGPEMFDHLIETVRLNKDRPGIVQAFVVSSAESITENAPGKEYFTYRYATLRAEITENILSLGSTGTVSEESALNAAAAVIAVMDGLQLQWLLDSDAVDLVSSTKFAIHAIIRSLLSASPKEETDSNK